MFSRVYVQTAWNTPTCSHWIIIISFIFLHMRRNGLVCVFTVSCDGGNVRIHPGTCQQLVSLQSEVLSSQTNWNRTTKRETDAEKNILKIFKYLSLCTSSRTSHKGLLIFYISHNYVSSSCLCWFQIRTLNLSVVPPISSIQPSAPPRSLPAGQQEDQQPASHPPTARGEATMSAAVDTGRVSAAALPPCPEVGSGSDAARDPEDRVPVPMNLFATWEIERSSPSCVPR